MAADLQIKLAWIPFTTKAGLREAEKTADRRATELTDEEHHHCRQGLARIADGLDACIAELEASNAAKIVEARALKPRARSAYAATVAEDMAHAKAFPTLNPLLYRKGPQAVITVQTDYPVQKFNVRFPLPPALRF